MHLRTGRKIHRSGFPGVSPSGLDREAVRIVYKAELRRSVFEAGFDGHGRTARNCRFRRTQPDIGRSICGTEYDFVCPTTRTAREEIRIARVRSEHATRLRVLLRWMDEGRDEYDSRTFPLKSTTKRRQVLRILHEKTEKGKECFIHVESCFPLCRAQRSGRSNSGVYLNSATSAGARILVCAANK